MAVLRCGAIVNFCQYHWQEKHAYALRTPHVVIFLSHISDSLPWQLFHLFHLWGRGKIPSLRWPLTHFLTLWPWPLTYDHVLWTWPRYHSNWPTCQNSSLSSMSVHSTEIARRTDTQTHTRCQNYYTGHVTDVGCKKHTVSKRANYIVRLYIKMGLD